MTAILEGETLKKAQRREIERVHSNLWGLGLALVTFIVFVPLGAASALREALGGGDRLLEMILFVLVFSIISSLIAFPISVYYGFTREKRDGMLKQNFLGWFLDELKQMAIGLIISTILFVGLFSAFRSFPDLWFPVALAGITVFFAVILFLSPKLARMRFKSAPLDNPELEARVQGLFNNAGQKLSKVSKWVFGEKITQGNAALVPDGFGSEVLISDTLMQSMDIEGIEVVLAHELGHRVHKDIQKNMIFAWFSFALMIAVSYFTINTLSGVGGIRGATDIAALPILLFVFTVLSEITGLARNAIIRRAEYAADRYAMQQTKNFPAFERAFRSLAKGNLSDPNPPEWIEIWLHDHPSIEKRIAAARAWAQTG